MEAGLQLGRAEVLQWWVGVAMNCFVGFWYKSGKEGDWPWRWGELSGVRLLLMCWLLGWMHMNGVGGLCVAFCDRAGQGRLH